MRSTDVLTDAFERVRDAVHPAATGLTVEELTFRPDGESNSLAWLLWHLARVQDAQVAAQSGLPEVWTASGWADRFALPLDDADTGYGHDTDTVAVVVAESGLLLGYFEDVHVATLAYLATLDDGDLDRVVDPRWDPPVTLGIRLVSIAADDLQHVGQAAYLRGIVQRR